MLDQDQTLVEQKCTKTLGAFLDSPGHALEKEKQQELDKKVAALNQHLKQNDDDEEAWQDLTALEGEQQRQKLRVAKPGMALCMCQALQQTAVNAPTALGYCTMDGLEAVADALGLIAVKELGKQLADAEGFSTFTVRYALLSTKWLALVETAVSASISQGMARRSIHTRIMTDMFCCRCAGVHGWHHTMHWMHVMLC